ncbi:3-beta hydroxysteroid dehydrogenase/isomerase family-domain-containing protein [Roridomyces roridus]|uniref:3-beta hydroxysteroid dehydrogenase/isomerase family-domain-containing protein n=1 Tax=Roridomyces roridus TaxID=1738132 RepID=A0AAD7BYQ5_9AGAR|nr:3-beta hydroxysteroid dehydrogenase/isomerase family-domain-containing protein [Roridomyces roridus]
MANSKDVYLVLGGDTFVGRHVVEQLKARNDTVFVFDAAASHADVQSFLGDIRDPDQISNAIQKTGATCIIHTLSPLSIANRENPTIFHDVNVHGTNNVISVAKSKGVRKLVYHGSSGVVFDGRDIANGDESLPYARKHPHPYTTSRIMAEKAVLAANDSNGLKTACIRPTGIYGVGDQEMTVGAYDTWKRGATHVQLGNNQNLCDRTYVSDIAHALILAADKLEDPAADVAGQTFFITGNEPILFWDFMRRMWAGFDAAFPHLAKPARKPAVIPRPLVFLLAYAMQFVAWITGREPSLTPYKATFATATMYFSSEKAKRLLGYTPKVSVDEGIRRTIEWVKAETEAGKWH